MLGTFLSYLYYGLLLGLALGVVVPFVLQATRKQRSFKGVHVVVTGGSKGIGKEIALQLVGLGAKVTLVARSKAGLDKAAGDIRAKMNGASVHVEAADCTDYDAVKTAIASAEETFGTELTNPTKHPLAPSPRREGGRDENTLPITTTATTTTHRLTPPR